MTGSEISESHKRIFLSALFEPLFNKVAETAFFCTPVLNQVEEANQTELKIVNVFSNRV